MPAGKQAISVSRQVRVFHEFAAERRHQVHHVRVAFDDHQFFDLHRAVLADSSEIVAAEIDQHDVFGALLFVGEQLSCERFVFCFSSSPRAACPQWDDIELHGPRILTSISGDEPTIVVSGILRKYMYGDGFTIRSAR